MASSLTRQAIMFIFVISTLYGLNYYWAMGNADSVSFQGLDDSNGAIGIDLSDALQSDSDIWGFVVDLILKLIGVVLEVVSWLSLFAVVKAIIYVLAPPELYTALNLFILRPVGWVAALITTEWVINKVRGSSEN